MLYRRHLHGRQKKGSKIGKTKRGKGTPILAMADGSSLPDAVYTESASPPEVTLVRKTLVERCTDEKPERLIGDKAYDSDSLGAELEALDIEMIAPHKSNHQKAQTEDGSSGATSGGGKLSGCLHGGKTFDGFWCVTNIMMRTTWASSISVAS